MKRVYKKRNTPTAEHMLWCEVCGQMWQKPMNAGNSACPVWYAKGSFRRSWADFEVVCPHCEKTIAEAE